MRKQKTQQQINDAKSAIKAEENKTRSDALNRVITSQDANRLKFDLRLTAAYAVLVTMLALGQAVATILSK